MSDFARNLDWNLLYTFMVVVQKGSITKAAEELLRTQPAVSLAIKRLEESTGTTLLVRNGNRFSVTPAGQALFEHASSIYSTITRLPLVFEQAPKSLTGNIRLATIDSVENEWFDELLSAFFARYPGVTLEAEVVTTADAIRMIELGTATLGISDGVIPRGLKKHTLMTERFGLYCSANHDLAGQLNVTDEELRNEPFVGFTADVLGGSHMGDVTAFRAKASMGQNVRARSSFVNEVKRMISCGMGIGFLPTHLGDAFAQQGKLFRLPPYEDEPEAEIYLITNPATSFSDAERAFLDVFDM